MPATSKDNDTHDGWGATAKANQGDTVVPARSTLSLDVNALAGEGDSTTPLPEVTNVHQGETVTITAKMTAAHASGLATRWRTR